MRAGATVAVLAGGLSVVLLLAWGGCGSSTCGPANCAGCCDAAGKCYGGIWSAACGKAGTACMSCSLGQACVEGSCAEPQVNMDAGLTWCQRNSGHTFCADFDSDDPLAGWDQVPPDAGDQAAAYAVARGPGKSPPRELVEGIRVADAGVWGGAVVFKLRSARLDGARTEFDLNVAHVTRADGGTQWLEVVNLVALPWDKRGFITYSLTPIGAALFGAAVLADGGSQVASVQLTDAPAPGTWTRIGVTTIITPLPDGGAVRTVAATQNGTVVGRLQLPAGWPVTNQSELYFGPASSGPISAELSLDNITIDYP